MPMNNLDVIVVGAGHAGIEAALAAVRLGARVLLLTSNLDHVGQMSCNPAIGGVGKGHLVKEIDALGGEMGVAIDETGIQFRTLNTRKGPAVRASRAQADKALYRQRMKYRLEQTPGLRLRQGMVEQLLLAGRRVVGVVTETGERYQAGATVLTTGTFLRGLMHIGDAQMPGGRAGDLPSRGLSAHLEALGLPVGRLKTGTCPRLDGRTIDFSRLEVQPGDPAPTPFSFRSTGLTQRQVPCHITWTTAETHQLIAQNLERSAMYSGRISSRGPRYCPSIEDKIVRFPDRERHQIFLEPEGLETFEIYPNGLSTSLPVEVQAAMVRSIPGLEQAEIVRPGYAIEYDFVDPRALHPNLECRTLERLFLAGQINGTTGYEEAAALGLMAGLNATRAIQAEPPVVLGRAEAYIGVMIDDLVSRGVGGEPYRMFTSRAEHRLLLREDNAYARLGELATGLGLLDEPLARAVAARAEEATSLRECLHSTLIRPDDETNRALTERASSPIRQPVRAIDLLRRPEADWALLRALGVELPVDVESRHLSVLLDLKYAGYVERQRVLADQVAGLDATPIPIWLDLSTLPGLSAEVRERLAGTRPATLGQAARSPGITPAAVATIALHLRRRAGERSRAGA